MVHGAVSGGAGSRVGETLDAHVKRVKEQLRAVPEQGLGYGPLRYLRDDEMSQRLEAAGEAQLLQLSGPDRPGAPRAATDGSAVGTASGGAKAPGPTPRQRAGGRT